MKFSLSFLTKIRFPAFFLVLSIFVLARIYYRVTDDFRISNINIEMAYHPEWENAPLTDSETELLHQILAQKFIYLGKGAQTYVFESADHRYVLKFFKFKHLKPSLFITLLPPFPPFSAWKEKTKQRKERKIKDVFYGYKLAYDVHKMESGLVYMQLNPSHVTQLVTLIDKLGFEREVDLGSIVYILQEKGKTFRNVLSDLLDKGHLELARQRIDQIFELYFSEYQKGIYDHDHGVMHNLGFVGDRPLHLDVGKLKKDPSIKEEEKRRKEDITLVAIKISKWLESHYPQFYPVLQEHIEKRIK